MNDKDLERLAQESEEEAAQEFSRRCRSVQDFRYDEIQEKYWDTTTGTLLGAKSVDGAIPRDSWPTTVNAKGKVMSVRPSVAINDIMTGLTVEGSTWWPGESEFLENKVVNGRGCLRKKGAVTYNTYCAPPDHASLRARDDLPSPAPWVEHIIKLWPSPQEHEHFLDFAAHMVQRPDQKVNHGLVLAGAQGIGKDTAMHPLRCGVGEWNAAEVDPDAISREVNGYVQAVLLIINEVRPHDEDHKSSNFYNQLKPLLAAPPDMLPMRVLYQNVIYVRNLCHVILTTNDPLTMFLPKEDRRLCVLTSPLPDPKKNPVFAEGYFDEIWKYMREEGANAVVKFLLERDISRFNPTSPPPMTAGKQAIIDSANQVRRTIIDELIEKYSEQISGKSDDSSGNNINGHKTDIKSEDDDINGHKVGSNYVLNNRPKVVFTNDLLAFINSGNYFDDEIQLRKLLIAKNFHFKMNEHGYDMMPNPYGQAWKCGKFRSRMAFIDKTVPQDERYDTINSELQRRPLTFDFE